MQQGLNKVILVDDDIDDRDMFAEAFEDLKVKAELLLFEDAQKFIEYLAKIERHLPTYVFLDLNMPVLSGMDCLKMLREKLEINDIFITIYSTSSSQHDIETAYLNGANGYLKKPTSFHELKDLIRKAIMAGFSNNGKQLKKEEFVLNDN